MDAIKGMQRIGWRFSQGKPFKPNDTDKEAYNAIVDFIDIQHKKQFKNNELFAKLYIYIYGKFLSHYQATVLDKIPRGEVYKILNRSIEDLIDEFTNELNDSEFYTLMENSGVVLKHPAFKDLAQPKEDAEKVDISKLNVWDKEEVTKLIEREINQAIDTFKTNTYVGYNN